MIAKRFDFGYDVIEKACKAVSDVISENRRDFFTVQYNCRGESSPLDDYLKEFVNAPSYLYSMIIFEKSKKMLRKEVPRLSEENANYILIPTLTHLLCSWCPKNQNIFSLESTLTKEYGLSECNSEIQKFVLNESRKTPEAIQEREILRKDFYREFWELPENKKLL